MLTKHKSSPPNQRYNAFDKIFQYPKTIAQHKATVLDFFKVLKSCKSDFKLSYKIAIPISTHGGANYNVSYYLKFNPNIEIYVSPYFGTITFKNIEYWYNNLNFITFNLLEQIINKPL